MIKVDLFFVCSFNISNVFLSTELVSINLIFLEAGFLKIFFYFVFLFLYQLQTLYSFLFLKDSKIDE